MKPKLLVLTSTFPRWQNDTDPPFVYELSSRLTGTFDVTVHAPHYPGARTREIMDGINVHRFRYFFAPFEKLAGSTGMLPTLRHNKLYYVLVPFFMMAQFFSLLLLVRKIRPDIIHAHWVIPQGFFAVLVQMLLGVPVVTTAHGADIFGLQGPLFNRIKRFTLKRVRAVTVVSNALIEALAEFAPPGIQPKIIPMGVDSKVFSPDKRSQLIRDKYSIDGPFLLYVGRLTEKKGVSYLVDSMSLVLDKFPTSKLLIVGSGELEENLQNQVRGLGLQSRIQFVGGVHNSELSMYYATADIFIGPSIKVKNGDTEGFGLTLVEAAMSGCVVVASDVGGIRDTIIHNETGFLVKPQDMYLLAERISYAVHNKNNLNELCQKSRQRCIEKYDWKVIADQYENLFKQVAGIRKFLS